jgi:hypothetical protein
VLPQDEDIRGIWQQLKEQVREVADDTKKEEGAARGDGDIGNMTEYTRGESKGKEASAKAKHRVPFRTLYLGNEKKTGTQEAGEEEDNKAEVMTIRGEGDRCRPRLTNEEPVR